jgi:hypothetical protein
MIPRCWTRVRRQSDVMARPEFRFAHARITQEVDPSRARTSKELPAWATYCGGTVCETNDAGDWLPNQRETPSPPHEACGQCLAVSPEANYLSRLLTCQAAAFCRRECVPSRRAGRVERAGHHRPGKSFDAGRTRAKGVASQVHSLLCLRWGQHPIAGRTSREYLFQSRRSWTVGETRFSYDKNFSLLDFMAVARGNCQPVR